MAYEKGTSQLASEPDKAKHRMGRAHGPAPVTVPKPAPAPVPAAVAPAPVVALPSAPVVIPTREELLAAIVRQLLGRSTVHQNSGVRVYDAQGAVMLEHSVAFVQMCLSTDDPLYQALVAGAVRVEVFGR